MVCPFVIDRFHFVCDLVVALVVDILVVVVDTFLLHLEAVLVDIRAVVMVCPFVVVLVYFSSVAWVEVGMDILAEDCLQVQRVEGIY